MPKRTIQKPLQGRHVLVTAGPTREYIDPVRFLSNPSTGRMGYALAEAARRAGAQVTLISGPVPLESPQGIAVIDVISAADMARATLKVARTADIILMSAAVADYRPERMGRTKVKKTAGPRTLKLVRTQDILGTLGERKKPGQLLVGFAAETRSVVKNAQDKLKKKNLDLIVANRIAKGNAFGARSNEVTVLYADGTEKALRRMSKERLARTLIEMIARLVDVDHAVSPS